MAARVDYRDPPWRSASVGQSYVYVFPCRTESILKLGFSRNPLNRLQSLHPRYFEFFDLDEAFVIETDAVKEARSIERRFRRELKLHNAPAPMVVASSAGGHTEWYRGAFVHMVNAANELVTQGYIVHRPIRSWLRKQLEQQGGLLFQWSAQMLAAVEAQSASDILSNRPTTLEWTLRNALDAYTAFDLPFMPLVSTDVTMWHAVNDSRFQ